MVVSSLGYVLIRSGRIDEWADYATRLLGMQTAEQTASTVALRMDERARRLVISAELPAHVFGWEVADPRALQALAARLESVGVRVQVLDAAERALRGISEGIAFDDPAGNRCELFDGAVESPVGFSPGRPISGFRTGALGMGHAVLWVERIDPLKSFYQRVLGFRVSDWANTPFKACFFHLNGRHHSLAMIETGRRGIHHLMVELQQFDDVGQGYDLALAESGRIATSLGRHTNDFMTSFYARTPDDFMIEYGWGGRVIDPDTWQASEMRYGPSLWGHERSWLPPDQLAQARAIRARAASDGLRQPVQVVEGSFQTGVAPQTWWER